MNISLQTPPTDDQAMWLAENASLPLQELCAAAAERRDRTFGTRLTWSPKVFLPVTNLCRNFCDYCSFRRSPGDPGEWTMTPDEIHGVLEQGRATGCTEALLCLGDTPESTFRTYRNTLSGFGFSSTVAYLDWASNEALQRGLFPHTNAGILDDNALALLRRTNVSMGLMLENSSPRLCEKGMPHWRARDKRPDVRIDMTARAGALRIPFTSGILIGIGETRRERIETLLEIRRLHRRYGHIQEVIVQNFRAEPSTPMADAPEPDQEDIAWTIAMARLILDDEVTVQAPPNLNPDGIELLIQAGINDFGGISPVTPDFINHQHPWPQIDRLQERCRKLGFSLTPRLPIHPRWITPEWIDAGLYERVVAHPAVSEAA